VSGVAFQRHRILTLEASHTFYAIEKEFAMRTCPAGRTDPVDRGSSRSIIIWEHYDVQFELTNPDPGHWVAVDVVVAARFVDSQLEPLEIVAGTGRTEEEAVCDLRSRIMAQLPMPPDMLDLFAVDWVPTGN
jgi:hypothetical protein